MKSLSLNYRLGAACALVIAIGAQPLAYAYPTGTLPIPPKPKVIEDIDPVAYPSGTSPIPPKPKAIDDNDPAPQVPH